MIGQGGPKTSRGRRRPTANSVAAGLFRCLTLALLIARAAAADEVRARIAWGGGENRLWTGTISVSEGSLAAPRPLGIEADEPGSMWIDKADGGDVLRFRQRSPRGYDGVDVLVSAPSSAKLLLRFTAADRPDHPMHVEIPLTDLSGEFVNRELDERGNRLLAMRAPGDLLRVSFAREHLIFAPGERFEFAVEPRMLPVAAEQRVRIRGQLLVGKKEHWLQQEEVAADDAASVPFELSMPGEEGVYDIIITAATSPNWTQAVRQPLSWRRTIAERRVQVVVLDPYPPPADAAKSKPTEVLEIDPANPRWYEKLPKLTQLPLTKSRLPRSWQGPLGNGCSTTRNHALGNLAELKPNADSPDVSWEAYWLPIDRPGERHVLEIEYPGDVSQTLRVGILEPDASGALTPLELSAGFDNAEEAVPSASVPSREMYRMDFWPRTATPLLLLANGRDRTAAVYGKIRVLAGGERPPRLSRLEGANRRLLAAYLDRPLFAENFSAGERLDAWSGRCLDDWWTFFEGASRLIEYLRRAGRNGLVISVAADGSAIYPSDLLQATPRYDTGIFFASAQDPVRKDALELLLRLFDREELQLIPSVEFAAPLPRLESLLREGGPDAEGVELIGPAGAAWHAVRAPRRGLAPYYNVLHPRVQAEMLGALRELAVRYAEHPSFAGLSLRLSADGYAQLPGPDWGLDDATIARFQRATGLRVPGAGPRRFARRAEFLAAGSNRRAWLQWRAAETAKFYRRAAEQLASIRPGCRLYLVGADIFGNPALENELRPALSRQTTFADALLQAGIDARHFLEGSGRIVLLRPERIAPRDELGRRAADLELAQMPDVDDYFRAAPVTGSFFFHQPKEARINSFDEKNPFAPGQTWLVCQPTPVGARNRQRFVHSLAALDAQVMVDGGWVLPAGGEDSLLNLASAYRALPAVRFQTVGGEQSAAAAQPATFRWCSHGGRTYLYAVNDAPFPVTAQLRVEAAPGCRLEELTGARQIEPLRPDARSGLIWKIDMGPYDLAAVRLSDPAARFSDPRVAWTGEIDAALALSIRRLGARAAALRNPPPLDVVVNPDFEKPAADDDPVPDWAATSRVGVEIKLDQTRRHDGRQSVKLRSDGPVACLASRPFVAPKTGRLTVSVWLRTEGARQPPLRLALEGKLLGGDYYRYAPVGAPPGPEQHAEPILTEWGRYVFQVDDLPLEGLASMRVRFDLMGAGEVWIDDVRIYNLAFTKPEMIEMSKLITLVGVKLQQRQVGDCVRLLESYWPQFLERNVPQPPGLAASETPSAAKQPEADKKPPERNGLLDRVKDMLPNSLRF
ncbi:MAG: hypothetical protein JW959_05025 [Pirellulales bacterium]|nr:hypothetical protein [Pirellulales bacterium]